MASRTAGNKPKGCPRISKAVGVVAGMLLLTATLPFLWHLTISGAHGHPAAHEEDESERKLSRIVRALQSVQVTREREERAKQLEVGRTLHEHFPWILEHSNHTLKNYFLSRGTQSTAAAAAGGDAAYQKGSVVFLHQHRSAGTSLEECIDEMARENHMQTLPAMTSDVRHRWDRKTQHDSANRGSSVKLHKGQFSFGMCNVESDRGCSYMTMFRDPMDRAVSSYFYCKTAQGDEMCKVLNANDVTLREWILHQGSLSFLQLLFNSGWCDSLPEGVNTSSASLILGSEYPVSLQSEQWPCWFKQKVWLENISPNEQKLLLSYVLQNLDSWFAAVGLVSEYTDSVRIFQEVYKLPFTKCAPARGRLGNQANLADNRASRGQHKKDLGVYDDNDPAFLKHDYFVRMALDADYQIFQKAKRLFHLQKQTVFNKVS